MLRYRQLRLRVNKAQAASLTAILTDSCETYNAALQERRDAWKLQRKRIGYYDQCAELTELRKDPAFRTIGIEVQREPLRRVDRAFKAFFRHVGHFAKSINDAAWGILLFQLAYKAESAGRYVIAVDPRGTSQKCSSCGAIVRKTLSERQHACDCGTILGRDHNAALNILALGRSAVEVLAEGSK